MSNVKFQKILKKSRISSSLMKGKDRNRSLFSPKSSSATLSHLRLKNNKLNDSNNNINQMSFLSINNNNNNFNNGNNSFYNFKDRDFLSERHPLSVRNELINKELFSQIDIFIEKDLMEEELIDEDNKIKTILNNLIFWDNEHLTERKENALNQSLMFNLKMEKEKEKGKENEPSFRKGANTARNDKSASSNNNQRMSVDTKIKSIKLKYDLLNPNIKSNENNKNNKFQNEEKDNKQLLYSEKDRKRLENAQKEELNQINQKIILNKYKKKKYNEVLNNTYHLLDKARTEYNLSIDLLEKRIESTQKYYEAILQDFEVQYHFKRDDKKNFTKSTGNVDLSSTSSTKKFKNKISNFEIYEAKIKSYREYLSIVEDLNNEIKKYEKYFENIQKELNDLIKSINQKLLKLNIDNSGLKKIYKELCYNETQYYLALLRKGRDTRKDGLCWIIKRLMELNIPITHNIFPKFLDKDQISYIIKMGKLEYEKIQLKTLIERIKERGKNNKILDKIENNNDNSTSNKDNVYKIFAFNNGQNSEDSYHNLYGSKIIDKLMKMYNNNYIMKNKLYMYKKQSNIDDNVVKDMKNKISIFAYNKDDKIFSEEKKRKKDNLDNLLNVNIKGKEQDYNILVLKDRERKLNWYIRNLRRKEFLIFKEKYRGNEIKDLVSKINYQKMFDALFGKNDFD